MKRKWEIQQQNDEYERALRIEDEKNEQKQLEMILAKSLKENFELPHFLPNPNIQLKFQLPDGKYFPEIQSYNEDEPIENILQSICFKLQQIGIYFIVNGIKIQNGTLKSCQIKNRTLVHIAFL